MKKLDTETFISNSIEKHGDKYDYSLVNYIDSRSNVTIICPIHGEFVQYANSHLQGIGCPECYGNKKMNTESFIIKAKEKHGNKYDYSKVRYINSNTKVIIFCKLHGEFEQIPKSHLRGRGCPRCVGKDKTHNQLIQDFKAVHGDTYDYSLVEYIKSKKHVKIICSTHGIFEQLPNFHLKGSGCPICKESKGERLISNYLDDKNIKYIRQKRFEDCKDKYTLPFDFYLPEHNLCIEYDGIQHFEPCEYFGGVDGFDERIKKDQIKTDFCKINNISLLRISYKDDIKNKIEHKCVRW